MSLNIDVGSEECPKSGQMGLVQVSKCAVGARLLGTLRRETHNRKLIKARALLIRVCKSGFGGLPMTKLARKVRELFKTS